MPAVNLSVTGERPRLAVRVLFAALLCTAWLAACADDSEPDTPPATPAPSTTPDTVASPTPAASPTAEVELLEFEIAGGQASPGLERVEIDQGTAVRIVVTSDQPDEIHLHGYDLEAPVGPGADGVIEFTADQTGLFELETHETALVLAQLQVQ